MSWASRVGWVHGMGQAQLELRSVAWSDVLDLRVRIALHTADAQLRDEGNKLPRRPRCELMPSGEAA